MRIVANFIAVAVLLCAAAVSTQAMAQEEAIQANSAAQAAQRDIERQGYRDVRGLAEDDNGVWHGRALVGHTEVQLLVDPAGNVSLNRGQ